MNLITTYLILILASSSFTYKTQQCVEPSLPQCKHDSQIEYLKKNCSGLDFKLTNAQRELFLELHNIKRTLHKSPPLVLSHKLSKYSQELATYLAKNRMYWHTPDDGYGENVFNSGWKKDYAEFRAADAIDAWYAEKYNRPNGHFTQMIWKDSAILGVGAAKGIDGSWYVVCNYIPAGNIASLLHANVLPLDYDSTDTKKNIKIVSTTLLSAVFIIWFIFFIH